MRLNYYVILLSTITLIVTSVYVVSEDINLDGLTYQGEFRKLGTNKKHKEEITFSHGKFNLSVCQGFHHTIHSCDILGFTETSYESTSQEDKTSFRAISKLLNEKDGYMIWEGTVKGEELNTCLSWHRKRYSTKEFCFTGILKK